MRQPVIAIDNVSAVYGRRARQVQALRGVALTVQPGEIFGLLGPNGAGKTTLLACVEGLHRPVQGSIQVAGLDVGQQPTAVKRKLGIQLQRTALLDDLTVSELLEVYAALYEVYLTQQQVADLLARFDLSTQRHVLARRLSGGQQQRLWCDTPACLIAALKAHTVLKMPAEFPLEEVRQLLGVQHVRHTDQHLEIETAQPLATLAALHELAAHCGRTVNNVLLRQPNLEDVFLSLTGRPLQT